MDLGPAGALLALFLLAHVLADFVLQTDALVQGKRTGEPGAFAAHGVVVLLTTGLAWAVFPAVEVLAAVVVLTAVHLVIDWAKVRWTKAHRAGGHRTDLGPFLGDQALHLGAIAAVWAMAVDAAGPGLLSAWSGGVVALDPIGLLGSSPAATATVALVAAAYLFNLWGASYLVRRVLDAAGAQSGEARDASGGDGEEDGEDGGQGGHGDAGEDPIARQGQMIGVLERLLVVTLILVGQWVVVGLYVGTKPFARIHFGEGSGDGISREYYIVGTLASVLVAVLSGLAVLLLV